MAEPENPVEIPVVAPPENELDENVVPTILPSDCDSYDESDEKNENADTSIQQKQRVVHPKYTPPIVRNVWNLHLWNQTDYMKENIDQSMSFAQVGNVQNEDKLSFL